MRRAFNIFAFLALAGLAAVGLLAQDTGLIMPVASVESSASSSLLSADSAAWNSIQPRPVHLNRTPPLYSSDPGDDGFRPSATAQFARAGEDLFVRVTWNDPTVDAVGRGARYPDAGEEHIYPQQTENTSGFADALCVMVPQERGPHSAYPSMMMGEGQAPVDLYFWRAGEGFSMLGAHGRETVERVEAATVEGAEQRGNDGWSVVIKVSNMPSRTPICFAIWDGNREQRDGLKYFSIWYEVE